MSALIERALQDSTDTRVAIVAEGAIDRVADVFTGLFGDGNPQRPGDLGWRASCQSHEFGG